MARLLIIDNDETVVAALSRLCDAAGHRCATADSSESARGALGSSEYDLIVVDLDLPGGAGPEVLDIAAADAPDAAIVILSAADEADRAAVLGKGTYGFVVKPFGENEIEVAVFNAL